MTPLGIFVIGVLVGGIFGAAVSRMLKPDRIEQWWEGVDAGKFLIQRCKDCGVLRHPPRPMCGECQSVEWDTVESPMKGTVHSFAVIHHPQVPGYDYPLACALIDLDEGVRFVSNVVDCNPADVHIGMKVEGTIEAVDDEMNLPLFRKSE